MKCNIYPIDQIIQHARKNLITVDRELPLSSGPKAFSQPINWYLQLLRWKTSGFSRLEICLTEHGTTHQPLP